LSRSTLASLAKELAVSRQTVSNVLNAPHRVKPATRARVQAAIEAAGYRPSAAARQLRTQRSMNFGMRLLPATDGINGSILDRFLHALTESAQAAGYRLTLFCADSDDDEVRQYQQLLDVAGLDGFIITSSSPGDVRTRWLQERGTFFAVFGRPWDTAGHPSQADHPWVDVDGAAGTEDAVNMLVAQGHSRIGFLGWSTGSPVGADRRLGWERAMRTAGLGAHVPGLSAGVEDTVAGGAAGAALLVSKGATAIVCSSDSLGLGALETLRELQPGTFLPGRTAGPGLRAAIVGFDDTPVAAALGLSSVAQPVEEAARHIIRVLTHELAASGAPGSSAGSGAANAAGNGIANAAGNGAAGRDAAPERHLLLAPRVVERIPLPLATPPPELNLNRPCPQAGRALNLNSTEPALGARAGVHAG
jgi:DNA-binding LacI/PurR family transcriptional regulator